MKFRQLSFDINKHLRDIKNYVEYQDNRIKQLEKTNKQLHDNAYKDKELQRMQKRLDDMQADYYRGFPITEAEEKAIQKWHKEHDAKVHGLKTDNDRIRAAGCCGGSLTYLLIPTSIGTIGEVKCHCGEKFCFRELN